MVRHDIYHTHHLHSDIFQTIWIVLYQSPHPNTRVNSTPISRSQADLVLLVECLSNDIIHRLIREMTAFSRGNRVNMPSQG